MTAPIPVIWNPTSGLGRAKRGRKRLAEVAQRNNVPLEWWATEGPGHATELARKAAADGIPLVLAFGGDGTYNEVAQGLTGSGTAMGILPGGTTSVFAYELGIPQDVGPAFELLMAGTDRRMSVGRTSAGELFLLMLSTGPDAIVLDRLPPALKRYGGKAGIAAQAMIELARAELPEISVSLEGEPAIRGGLVIVGNGECYGGPFRATPGASPFAPDLVAVVQVRTGRSAAVPFYLSLPRGRHVERPDVVLRRVSRIRLEPSGDAPVPYQLDGDPVGTLPVEAWVEPEALLVRIPPATPGRTPDGSSDGPSRPE